MTMYNDPHFPLVMDDPAADKPEHVSFSATPLLSRSSNALGNGRHEWTIEDFVQREDGIGVSLQTRFSVPAIDNKGANINTVWRLKLYPKGCDEAHSEHISVFINQVSGPGSVWVKYAISVLGWSTFSKRSYVHTTRRGSVQFVPDRRSSSRGWKKFISLDTVRNPGASILHDGALVVRCTVEVQCRSPSTSEASNHVSSEETFHKHSRSLCTQSFFGNMKYCDITLVCDEREFSCHKFMLAKKSDVFDAMFSHDFRETATGRVIIKDLDEKAVAEMIRYIYTGHVHGMEKVNRDLMAAADKYNIVDLKELCEKSLCSSMTVENVCSLLLFAQDRHVGELKNKAIDFIARNVQAVTDCDDWKNLVNVPVLMTDVVRAMASRPN